MSRPRWAFSAPSPNPVADEAGAVEAGFYRSALMLQDYPRFQILTIAERAPRTPPRFSPYELATRQKRDSEQRGLFGERAGSA